MTHKTGLSRLAGAVAGIMAMGTAGTAGAISTGTDLNLSAHPAAGGMGGAAYVRPQEPSAALFGNPATLTQFKGVNFNFGATYLHLEKVSNVQTATLPGVGTFSNESSSGANDYLAPVFGSALEIMPGLVAGIGLEASEGLGSDVREDPVRLLGGAAGTTLPLVVEVIAFNANVGAAYQVTPRLSVGGALTIGFALAQLGTTGPATLLGSATSVPPNPLSPLFDNFGGTTADVHDIGIGGNLGAVYEILPKQLWASVAWKSEVSYNFDNILFVNPNLGAGGAGLPGIPVGGWQDLPLQEPQEFQIGLATEGTLLPNLLLEADAVYKDYSGADSYQDLYRSVWLLNFGAQLSDVLLPGLKLRVGYKHRVTDEVLKDHPPATIGGLAGVGSVPLGNAAAAAGTAGIATEVIGIVQTVLVPASWQDTVSFGAGFNVNPALRLDVYGAVAFNNDDTVRHAPNLAGALSGLGLVPAGTTLTYANDNAEEWIVGFGINVAMP